MLNGQPGGTAARIAGYIKLFDLLISKIPGPNYQVSRGYISTLTLIQEELNYKKLSVFGYGAKIWYIFFN